MIALINLSTETFIRSWNVEQEIAIRVDLPDGTQVSPITLGWARGDYTVWSYVPFTVPNGQRTVGNPTYSFDSVNKVVTQSYTTEAIPVTVPFSISPLQARKALRAVGLKASVDAYVANLPEEQQEEWEYAVEVQRNNAIIAAGAAALGMTSQQVDDLFILGATL